MRRSALVALVVVAWCAGLAVPELHVGLLYVAPAILFVALLLAGRYPGERLLQRLSRMPRLRLASSRAPRPRPAPARALKREIAWALAGRAPPA